MVLVGNSVLSDLSPRKSVIKEVPEGRAKRPSPVAHDAGERYEQLPGLLPDTRG
jgi:hypothetical protein